MTRNILNLDEVERFVADLAAPLSLEAGRRWLSGTFRRWLLRDWPEVVPVFAAGPAAVRIGRRARPVPLARLPAWVARALERGDTVLALDLANARAEAGLLQAWLSSPEAAALAGRLSRVAVPDALTRARRLADERAIASTTTLLARWPGGWMLVELGSEAALIDEGRRMHHCIASYWAEVEVGEARVLSLRCQGKALMTVLLIAAAGPGRWQLVDARGPCNAEPMPEALARLSGWAGRSGALAEGTLAAAAAAALAPLPERKA